ncbi:MAG: paraquat-inducible protein A [bacterium]|nr:paraquat-inducible protein A [bacterium]
MTRNTVALILILVSFAILVPGLMQPLITISASMEFLGVPQEIYKDTRSILQTIENLHNSGNDFVAGLILLFSVLVPIFKGILLIVVLAMREPHRKYRIFTFVRNISKWSMADVFVVGVYVAFLASKATDALDAEMHSGFYFFTFYCIVSLIALQFMRVDDPDHSVAGAAQ